MSCFVVSCGAATNAGNFAGLRSLKTIKGDLSVLSHKYMESFRGLENLEEIGGNFILKDVVFLASAGQIDRSKVGLAGLQKLKVIKGSIVLETVNFFETLDGLDALEEIGGYVTIRQTPFLVSTSGLAKLAKVGSRFPGALQHPDPVIRTVDRWDPGVDIRKDLEGKFGPKLGCAEQPIPSDGCDYVNNDAKLHNQFFNVYTDFKRTMNGMRGTVPVWIEIDRRKFKLPLGLPALKFIKGQRRQTCGAGELVEYVPGATTDSQHFKDLDHGIEVTLVTTCSPCKPVAVRQLCQVEATSQPGDKVETFQDAKAHYAEACKVPQTCGVDEPIIINAPTATSDRVCASNAECSKDQWRMLRNGTRKCQARPACRAWEMEQDKGGCEMAAMIDFRRCYDTSSAVFEVLRGENAMLDEALYKNVRPNDGSMMSAMMRHTPEPFSITRQAGGVCTHLPVFSGLFTKLIKGLTEELPKLAIFSDFLGKNMTTVHNAGDMSVKVDYGDSLDMFSMTFHAGTECKEDVVLELLGSSFQLSISGANPSSRQALVAASAKDKDSEAGPQCQDMMLSMAGLPTYVTALVSPSVCVVRVDGCSFCPVYQCCTNGRQLTNAVLLVGLLLSHTLRVQHGNKRQGLLLASQPFRCLSLGCRAPQHQASRAQRGCPCRCHLPLFRLRMRAASLSSWRSRISSWTTVYMCLKPSSSHKGRAASRDGTRMLCVSMQQMR